MTFNYKKIAITVLAAASLAVVGCKKDYLNTTPTNQIAVGDLFSTTKGAYTLLNGMHNLITSPGAGNQGSIAADWAQKAQDLGHDAMGTDMVLTSSQYDWFIYYYQYVATQAANYWMPYISWTYYYKLINNANLLIENIDAASGPDGEKNDIKGQALAYRAWAYSRLVSDFSLNHNAPGFATAKGVPMPLLPTDINTIPEGRGTAKAVYDQIIIDIKEAIRLLDLVPTARPNKSHINIDVAHGIYARIALTMKDYQNAALHAELARTNYPLMSGTELTKGFNTNQNPEWMWASALSSEQNNGRGLANFISWMDIDAPGYAQVGATRAITKDLYYTMPINDVRRGQFYDTLAAAGTRLVQKKFFVNDPSGYDYNDLLMRASEMYLIEIEARATMNPTDGRAIDLLEELMDIRQPGYSFAATGRTLLDETLLQRRIELWGEGFGIDDIKRLQIPLTRPTGRFNHTQGTAAVLTLPVNSPRLLFKLPQREMDNNPNLTQGDQNP